MGRIILKTEYLELGPYASLEKRTMYAAHNSASDTVSFYDQEGNCFLSVDDTMDNNAISAINRLYNFGDKKTDGIEQVVSLEEIKKLGL